VLQCALHIWTLEAGLGEKNLPHIRACGDSLTALISVRFGPKYAKQSLSLGPTQKCMRDAGKRCEAGKRDFANCGSGASFSGWL
jgi:hypothetical protein